MGTHTYSDGTVSIRHATHDDVALLIELGEKTFHDTFADVNTKADMDMYLEKNFNVPQVYSEISDINNIFFIAECNATPAGYAKLRKGSTPAELNGEKAIELERLYATKAFIGKSVGRMLMDKCVSLAKEQGYATLWLGVWEHNLRAIAFYQKCGFEKFSSHPFMLGTDVQTDHMMKKNL